MKKKRIKKLLFRYRFLIAIVLTPIILFGLLKVTILKDNLSEGYLANTSTKVTLYDYDLKVALEIPRGVKVASSGVYEEDYREVVYKGKKYLIKKENLVADAIDAVMEDKLYVRTPATLYLENDLSLIKKGEEVEILNFDSIDENGVVNQYNVKYNNLEGKVYGKYLVTTKEESLNVYDEEGTYQVHVKAGNQGGGDAENLDFFPFEKKPIEGNVLPDEVRALYIVVDKINDIDKYIAAAKDMKMNALVVDIKDGVLGYKSPVAEKYSPTTFKRAAHSLETYKAAIKKVKDAGLYVIGRITLFKDSSYAADHPEDCITTTSNGQLFYHNNAYWPSAFSRDVWYYNVELAKEAVKEMGFNEIQFDYIRFPDKTWSLESDGIINMKNEFNEQRAQAIQAFAMYAFDELRSVGAYISADVFGEAAHYYVTGYGQYWGAISNVVDVISPMPYPDHFSPYEYGFEEVVWTVPYKLLNFWGENHVMKRQAVIPTPAKVRTWIQTYSVQKSPQVTYGVDKVIEQISGLYDAGLDGGFMTWSATSYYPKYVELKPAFIKEY